MFEEPLMDTNEREYREELWSLIRVNSLSIAVAEPGKSQ